MQNRTLPGTERPAVALADKFCEEPRIGPHREEMRRKLAALLGVDLTQVSVKATTTERLGFTGRGEGIAAQAVATLVSRDDHER